MNASSGRLPNFLALGAPRCATTWLHATLAKHPDIFIAPMKEPEFFGNPPRFALGTDWYRSLFAGCGKQKRVGEVSVNSFHSPEAPVRIRETIQDPDLKLIVLLREPIDRALSHYQIRLQKGEAPPTFEQALDDPKMPLRGEGHYIEDYRRYRTLFSKEQIGIFLYEDIERDARKVLKDICVFLNVDPSFFDSYQNMRVNKSEAVRSVPVSMIIGYLGRAIRFVLPYGGVGERIRERLQRWNMRWNRKPGTMPLRAETRKALEKEYAQDNDFLAREAEISLSAWKYR